MITHTDYETVPAYRRWRPGNPLQHDGVPHWSGKAEPHAVGETVSSGINHLGQGIVEGYFVEGNWLGLKVRLLNQPEWHKRQNKEPIAYLFGAELDPQ